MLSEGQEYDEIPLVPVLFVNKKSFPDKSINLLPDIHLIHQNIIIHKSFHPAGKELCILVLQVDPPPP
jgi:hypothetical protein